MTVCPIEPPAGGAVEASHAPAPPAGSTTGEGSAVAMTELDGLIDQLGRERFLVHAFQADQPGGPDVLAFTRDWYGTSAVDVVIFYSEKDTIAYRTARLGLGTDVFAPVLVSWSYAGNAVWTLRAVLTLAHPRHPTAPRAMHRPQWGNRPLVPENRTPVRTWVPQWRPEHE